MKLRTERFEHQGNTKTGAVRTGGKAGLCVYEKGRKRKLNLPAQAKARIEGFHPWMGEEKSTGGGQWEKIYGHCECKEHPNRRGAVKPFQK